MNIEDIVTIAYADELHQTTSGKKE